MNLSEYKKFVACCYSYQLVSHDDKCSKLFKWYLGEDAVILSSMIKESKCYSDVMKEYFNKELVMAKKKMTKVLRTVVSVRFVVLEVCWKCCTNSWRWC